MDRTTCFFGFRQILSDFIGGFRFVHSYLSRLISQSWLWTSPYNIINTQFISKNDASSTVHINQGIQIGMIQTKIVEEGTILTKMVNIVRIIHRTFFIAHQKQQTRRHLLNQLISTLTISSGSKHSLSLFFWQFGKNTQSQLIRFYPPIKKLLQFQWEKEKLHSKSLFNFYFNCKRYQSMVLSRSFFLRY